MRGWGKFPYGEPKTQQYGLESAQMCLDTGENCQKQGGDQNCCRKVRGVRFSALKAPSYFEGNSCKVSTTPDMSTRENEKPSVIPF